MKQYKKFLIFFISTNSFFLYGSDFLSSGLKFFGLTTATFATQAALYYKSYKYLLPEEAKKMLQPFVWKKDILEILVVGAVTSIPLITAAHFGPLPKGKTEDLITPVLGGIVATSAVLNIAIKKLKVPIEKKRRNLNKIIALCETTFVSGLTVLTFYNRIIEK